MRPSWQRLRLIVVFWFFSLPASMAADGPASPPPKLPEIVTKAMCESVVGPASKPPSGAKFLGGFRGLAGAREQTPFEYAQHKLMILYSVSKTEALLKDEAGPEFSEAKQYLTDFKNGVAQDQLPLLKFLPVEPRANAMTVTHFEGNLRSLGLVLGWKYFHDYYEDPLLFDGILLHEIVHLGDWRKKPNAMVLTSAAESRAHLVQAHFYLASKRRGSVSRHPRFALMIDAMNDAPRGPKWRTYLQQQEQTDFMIADFFQRAVGGLPQLPPAQGEMAFKRMLQGPELALIKRQGQWLREKVKHLEEIPRGSPEERTMLDRFQQISTYIQYAEIFEDSLKGHLGEFPPALVKLEETWKTDLQALAEGLKEVVMTGDFVDRLGMTPITSLPPLDEEGLKNRAEFGKWVADNLRTPWLQSALALICETTPRK